MHVRLCIVNRTPLFCGGVSASEQRPLSSKAHERPMHPHVSRASLDMSWLTAGFSCTWHYAVHRLKAGGFVSRACSSCSEAGELTQKSQAHCHAGRTLRFRLSTYKSASAAWQHRSRCVMRLTRPKEWSVAAQVNPECSLVPLRSSSCWYLTEWA